MQKILIIEDNTVVAAMYEKAFAGSGYQALVATGGDDGLRQAGAAHPDLILLDVRMPVVDGLEVLRQLKAGSATKAIPVVILTNLAGSPEVQAALDLGAVRFIVKSETRLEQVKTLVHDILADKAN